MITTRIEVYEHEDQLKSISNELVTYICENFVTEEEKDAYLAKGDTYSKFAITMQLEDITE